MLLLFMSTAASSCGTFAWFIYTTRASALYDGISIGCGELQAGLVTNEKFENYEAYSLKEEVDGDRYIYWAPHIMPSSLIREVLSMNGYARFQYRLQI